MLVAAGLGGVEMESVASEVQVARTHVDDLVADNSFESTDATVQVEGSVKIRETAHSHYPFNNDATVFLPIEVLQAILPEEARVNCVLAALELVCCKGLHC